MHKVPHTEMQKLFLLSYDSCHNITDLCVWDASAHYEGVSLTAGVSVAVHPVTTLATPSSVTEHIRGGTTHNLLTLEKKD